ncbi:MAG TPA: hypothetical protein VFI91_13235, partial [Longimicrobiaceae bacterium]|nr:hypothetical protein [Longimicrobiaceae bacterium]
MRSGWNPELAKRLHRTDPAARIIVEGIVSEVSDVRLRYDQWQAADVIEGAVRRFEDGSVQLFRSAGTPVVESTSGAGEVADFQPDGSFRSLAIAWEGDDWEREISLMRLNLIAQADAGLAKEVAQWKLSLYQLVAYTVETGLTYLELRPLIDSLYVPAAGGTAAAWVDFDFSQSNRPPRIGPPPEHPEQDAGSAEPLAFPGPTTFLFLAALTADGSPAGNTSWVSDPAKASAPGNGCDLAQYVLSPIDGKYLSVGSSQDLPQIEVYADSGLLPASIGFASAGNRISVPGASAEAVIELTGQGETPSGSDLTYEVSADNVSWTPYRDGDVVGEGALAALARQDFYYLRATLQPNLEGTVSPTLRALGAAALRRVDLDGLARVSTGGWSVDPVTLRGEIAEATISVNRDGPRDYRDLATELLALYYTKELTFKVWVGHP